MASICRALSRLFQSVKRLRVGRRVTQSAPRINRGLSTSSPNLYVSRPLPAPPRTGTASIGSTVSLNSASAGRQGLQRWSNVNMIRGNRQPINPSLSLSSGGTGSGASSMRRLFSANLNPTVAPVAPTMTMPGGGGIRGNASIYSSIPTVARSSVGQRMRMLRIGSNRGSLASRMGRGYTASNTSSYASIPYRPMRPSLLQRIGASARRTGRWAKQHKKSLIFGSLGIGATLGLDAGIRAAIDHYSGANAHKQSAYDNSDRYPSFASTPIMSSGGFSSGGGSSGAFMGFPGTSPNYNISYGAPMHVQKTSVRKKSRKGKGKGTRKSSIRKRMAKGKIDMKRKMALLRMMKQKRQFSKIKKIKVVKKQNKQKLIGTQKKRKQSKTKYPLF